MVPPECKTVFRLDQRVVDPLPLPKSDVELNARIQEKLHPTGVAGSRAFNVSTYELEEDEANQNPHKTTEERVFDPLPSPKTDAQLDKIIALKNTDKCQEHGDEEEYRAAVGLPSLLLGA